jgi:CRISPR-associated protein Cmr2
VQGFIEKSRKLRDLYGSSYLLSFLAQSICIAAKRWSPNSVISPALPNITQGMPNQIIIRGAFSKELAKKAFQKAWAAIAQTCRLWIEANVTLEHPYAWERQWDLWTSHAWEFFYAVGKPGESITQVRERLNEKKRSRAWTGVNWQGESSTLSGADAIAYPEIGHLADPRNYNYRHEKEYFDRFYNNLIDTLGISFANVFRLPQERARGYGEAFIDPREQLSIPELIKRLITHVAIVEELAPQLQRLYRQNTDADFAAELNPLVNSLVETIRSDLHPNSFRDLNRLPQRQDRLNSRETTDQPGWTGWFMGDGDGASDYLKWRGNQAEELRNPLPEEEATQSFSEQMRRWGETFKTNQSQYLPQEQGRLEGEPTGQGRIIYAGGDDFLGVLYNPNRQIQPWECANWFSTFESRIWYGIRSGDNPDKETLDQPITVSVGFVWASPQVPQRDVLQHCREAEKAAKLAGKCRIAFRLLFGSGTHLEWICPWWILEEGQLFASYRDRNKRKGEQNWSHIYEDVATLEARHAFQNDRTDVATALFKAYFGEENCLLSQDYWWNTTNEYNRAIRAGILGDPTSFDPSFIDTPETRQELNCSPKVIAALNNWTINLGKVGFHLHRNYE